MSVRRKFLLTVLVTCCLIVAAGLVALFGPDPAIIVSRETTYITEPLTSEGLPDYEAWLLRELRKHKPANPEDNAAVHLLRAVWAGWDTFGRDSTLLLRELGIDEPPISTLQESPGEVLDAWLQQAAKAARVDLAKPKFEDPREKFLEDAGTFLAVHPWRRRDCPPLADWLTRQQPVLEQLLLAAECPRFYCPPLELLEEGSSSIVSQQPLHDPLMQAARLVNLRGLLYLGEGDSEQAFLCFRALHLLGERQGVAAHQLIDAYVAGSFYKRARRGFHHLATSPRTSPQILEQLAALLAKHPPRLGFAQAIDTGDRVGLLQFAVGLRADRTWLAERPSPVALLAKTRLDWNQLLGEINRSFDLAAKALRQPDDHRLLAEAKQAFATWPSLSSSHPLPEDVARSFFSLSGRSELLKQLIVFEFVLPSQHPGGNLVRHRHEHQLLQVAVAIERFRRDQQRLPNELVELVPEHLASLPAAGQPRFVMFQPTEEGYLLYTFGGNGQDDEACHARDELVRGLPVEGVWTLPTVFDRLLPELPPALLANLRHGSVRAVLGETPDDYALRMPPLGRAMPRFPWRRVLRDEGGYPPDPFMNSPDNDN